MAIYTKNYYNMQEYFQKIEDCFNSSTFDRLVELEECVLVKSLGYYQAYERGKLFTEYNIREICAVVIYDSMLINAKSIVYSRSDEEEKQRIIEYFSSKEYEDVMFYKIEGAELIMELLERTEYQQYWPDMNTEYMSNKILQHFFSNSDIMNIQAIRQFHQKIEEICHSPITNLIHWKQTSKALYQMDLEFDFLNLYIVPEEVFEYYEKGLKNLTFDQIRQYENATNFQVHGILYNYILEMKIIEIYANYLCYLIRMQILISNTRIHFYKENNEQAIDFYKEEEVYNEVSQRELSFSLYIELLRDNSIVIPEEYTIQSIFKAIEPEYKHFAYVTMKRLINSDVIEEPPLDPFESKIFVRQTSKPEIKFTPEMDQYLEELKNQNLKISEICIEMQQRFNHEFTSKALEQRWRRSAQPNIVKGAWTKKEDELLKHLFEKFNGNIIFISWRMKQRTLYQIRERCKRLYLV